MSSLVSPINYAAGRKALVQAIAMATGLSPSNIIRAQAQGPVQPVPSKPYATFMFRIASMRTGFRDQQIPAPDVSSSAIYYRGNRGVAVDVNFFGGDQEVAYGLAAAMQAGLSVPNVRQVLAQANFSVWQIGDVTDVSALLNTGYEGRALLEFQMWTSSTTLYDPGEIFAVNAVGEFSGEFDLD